VDPILHIKDLRCFVSVYDLRSFSRAADALNTVQSLVSTRVQRLERFVGLRLFARLPHGIEPNEHGEVVYRHATKLLRNLADLEAELGRGAA
jgi:DNA-binding transcriptional LysR family regulator